MGTAQKASPNSPNSHTGLSGQMGINEMIERRDYEGLVRLLPTLRHLADSAGLVTLEAHEAEQIEKLGFAVQPGAWCVPRLPAHLVHGNPLLEHLGDDLDPFWRPRLPELDPKGQVEIVEPPPILVEVTPLVVVEKDCMAILAAVERNGGRVERRTLQKKLWRLKAGLFNHAIQILVNQGAIRIEGKTLISRFQPDPPMFHAVPPSSEGVPPGESGADPPGRPDRVNGFRGGVGNAN